MKPKNKGGRPRKYQTPQQMEVIINAYFAECRQNNEPCTVEGLCLSLNIDRATLLDYEKKYDEFSHTIKKAKLKVQRDVVVRGLSGKSNPTVTIFVLKNCFGYEDRTVSEFKQEPLITGFTREQLVDILSDEY